MASRNTVPKGPVMGAATRALETGDANYILIWVPEESENTLKNLLEKACCERRTQKNAKEHSASWYFSTINHLHSVRFGPHNLNMSTKTPKEKSVILLVERACESGNVEEITTVIRDTSNEEIRLHFHDLVKKRDYDRKNVAAGRAYAAAFTAFVARLNTIRSGVVQGVEQ